MRGRMVDDIRPREDGDDNSPLEWNTALHTHVLHCTIANASSHLLSLFSLRTRRLTSSRPFRWTQKLPRDMRTENGSWMGPRR